MLVKKIAQSYNHLLNNQYFQKLKEIPDTKYFIQSQYCFLKAIDSWSSILALMIPKCHTPEQRLVFINNLYDEHGNGDVANAHVNTFIRLLTSLDHNCDIELTKSVNSDMYGKSVYNFVMKLEYSIEYENFTVLCAMLAIIEYIYIDASCAIHQYLCNFLEPNEINHYSAHEIVDVKHSDELFSLLELNDNTRKDIEKGFSIGYEMMNTMYHNMSHFL